MKLQSILYILVVIGIAIYMSYTFGDVIKTNTYFLRNVNIYFIETGFFIFSMIAFVDVIDGKTPLIIQPEWSVKPISISDSYEQAVKIDKPHKQTYLEYVNERLKVERMMK